MANEYGSISPRTAAYVQKQLLERSIPLLPLEPFCDGKPVPSRSTKSTKFRRYNSLPTDPAYLTEGVTPAGTQLTYTDISADLVQMGGWIPLTDVVRDTHEDPILQESVDLIGEQAPVMVEKMRFGIFKAGTNVFYANGAQRSDVNTPVTRDLLRRVTRALKRQNAPKFTKIAKSSVNYGSQAVAAGYVGFVHTDLENDLYDLPGFKRVEDYGSQAPFLGEIGTHEHVRFISSTVFEPWADAGGAAGSMISTGGSNADVYPILIMGMHACATVPLKGKSAITPIIKNPDQGGADDPLNQRGSVGWKTMQTAAIQNDLWLARLEVAVNN